MPSHTGSRVPSRGGPVLAGSTLSVWDSNALCCSPVLASPSCREEGPGAPAIRVLGPGSSPKCLPPGCPGLPGAAPPLQRHDWTTWTPGKGCSVTVTTAVTHHVDQLCFRASPSDPTPCEWLCLCSRLLVCGHDFWAPRPDSLWPLSHWAARRQLGHDGGTGVEPNTCHQARPLAQPLLPTSQGAVSPKAAWRVPSHPKPL